MFAPSLNFALWRRRGHGIVSSTSTTRPGTSSVTHSAAVARTLDWHACESDADSGLKRMHELLDLRMVVHSGAGPGCAVRSSDSACSIAVCVRELACSPPAAHDCYSSARLVRIFADLTHKFELVGVENREGGRPSSSETCRDAARRDSGPR